MLVIGIDNPRAAIQSRQAIKIHLPSGHGQAVFQFVRQLAKIAVIEIRQGLQGDFWIEAGSIYLCAPLTTQSEG